MAAMLFPVFAGAKSVALKSACLSHFHSVGQAFQLYTNDYDQFAPIVNLTPGATPNSRTDRTWVQLLLPYVSSSFSIFQCPSDTSDQQGLQATFDQDLVPGDLYSEYYTASLRTNVGYNFQYLAPILKENGTWQAEPKELNAIPDPSEMLLYADSAWQVTNGVPSGGGSWLISPPCRYAETDNGHVVDTIAGATDLSAIGNHGKIVFAPSIGWGYTQDTLNQYGGVFTWHQGLANICRVDGSAKALSMAEISNGCNVQPAWSGDIYNRSVYIWSPQ